MMKKRRIDMSKISNPNRHIEEYLNEYIEFDKPGFAVLITGSWGCGKTYFIDHYISEVNAEKRKRFVRISLNGTRDTADICGQILIQLCTSKLSKAIPLVGKIVAGASKFFNVDGIISAQDLVNLESKELAPKILIIDDLERCGLPISETLGFLNSFIETHGLKVVLLGYEEEIVPDDFSMATAAESKEESEKEDKGTCSREQARYRRIREKVIGKTFVIEEHAEAVVPSLIENQPEFLKSVLQNNCSTLISIVQITANDKRDEYNYRALQHTLRDFHLLCKKINAEYLDHPALMRDLLHTFCAIGYEIQLGKLVPSEILDEKYCFPEILDPKTPKAGETKIDVLLERHSIKINDIILGKTLLAQIFDNKAISDTSINEALGNSVYFYKEKTFADYVSLWYWRDQEDEDAAEIVKRVRDGLAEYRYTIPGEILHLFDSLLALSANSAIPESKEDILSMGKKYVEHLAATEKLLISSEHDDIDDLLVFGHGGLGYFSKETPEFQAIGNLLYELGKETVRKKQIADLPNILKELATNTGEVCGRLSQGDLRTVDVFKEVTPDEFFEALMKIPNRKKSQVAFMLKNRYGHADVNPHVFRNEFEFLKNLDRIIQLHLKSAPAYTPSVEMLKFIRRDYLAPALEKVRRFVEEGGKVHANCTSDVESVSASAPETQLHEDR